MDKQEGRQAAVKKMLSPAIDNVKPVVDLVERRFGKILSQDAVEVCADFLSFAFASLKQMDDDYLASDNADPSRYEFLRSCYEQWVCVARQVRSQASGATMQSDSVIKLNADVATAERALRDYARAKIGERRLAERLESLAR